MKKKLLFKTKGLVFYNLMVFLLCFSSVWSQQVIGEFPNLDGGLENQTATTNMSSNGSTSTPTTTDWTVSSQSNTNVREITNNSAMARSGNFFASMSIDPTRDNARLQSPSTVPGPNQLQTNTEYTIQFFYRTDVDPTANGYLDGGIYLNSTSGGVASDVTNVPAFAANTWVKAYSTITTGANFNSYDDNGTTRYRNWAVVRISTPAANVYNNTVNFDDYVVYAGVYDDVAPGSPTSGTYTTSGAIGWTAPASTVDGGGYVVVKYTADPGVGNDPNQNGIYQVGNSIGTGTVVYIGTATSYSEPTYAPGNFYKIYAVDKAFNYSDELVISDATLSVAQIEIEGLKIYPNPTKETITIEGKNVNITAIELYNLVGQKVKSQTTLENNHLDVSDISKGIYLLKVSTKNASTSKKIVID